MHTVTIPPLKYYQAKEEPVSYMVYFSRENCINDFPNDEILEFRSGDIELPTFKDLETISVKDIAIIDLFSVFSVGYFDTSFYLNDNDEPILGSIYATVILNLSELPSFDKLEEALLAYFGIEEEPKELKEVYEKLVKASETNKYIQLLWED